MRKYLVKPINSYAYYKFNKRKIKKATCLVGMIGCIEIMILLVMHFFIGTLTQTHVKKEEHSPIYLNDARISYHLYSDYQEVRGIYVPAEKINDYEQYIKFCKQTKVNSIVIDFKTDQGYLTVDSDNRYLKQMGVVPKKPKIKDIKRMLLRFNEEGIYPIARIVAFKDNVIPQKYPERAVKDLKGNVYKTSSGDMWLDPYNKDNWRYLLECAKEASMLGFKEVQFDYIRFHESMNKDKVILEQNISKTEIITRFTQYISENLESYQVNVSADVFGTVILSKEDGDIVGQDFIKMCEYLDYICPMIYPSHYASGTFGIEYPHLDAYDIILKTMQIAEKRLNENPTKKRKAKIRPWLQSFTLENQEPKIVYGPQQIKAQIKGAQDAHINEWLFWNAAGQYDISALAEE